MMLRSTPFKLCLKTSAHICITVITLFFLAMTQAVAGLMANSTRVIIYEQPKQAKAHYSLVLANRNPYPVVSQVWVDDGLSHTQSFVWPNTTSPTAFDVLPTIFKLSAHEVKALRIVQNHSQLAPTQESVMWLNLLEMPLDTAMDRSHISSAALQTTSSNPPQVSSVLSNHSVNNAQQYQVSLMMNTQLKLFYRPKALKPMTLNQREKALDFRVIFNPPHTNADVNMSPVQRISAIEVHNPTGYHITFAALQLEQMAKIQSAYHTDMMIAPYQRKRFELHSGTWQPQPKDQLRYVLIDDEGQHQVFYRTPVFKP